MKENKIKITNNNLLNNKLNELLYNEEFDGEKSFNRFVLCALLLAIIIVLTNFVFTKSILKSNYFVNLIIFFTWLVYHLVLFILLKNNIFNKSFKYITVTINITAITILIICYSITSGWVHSLRTFTIAVYYITIAGSGFYQKERVTIYAGVLASIQYILLFFYAVFFTETPIIMGYESFRHHALTWDLLFYQPVVFIFLAVIVAYNSKRLKKLVKRSLHWEAEAYIKEKAKDAIEKASKQKTDFFLNLAHETKTPLMLIMNYLDSYIKKHKMNDELRIIKTCIDKLVRTLVNFINIHKFERDEILYDHSQVVNLRDVFNYKLNLFESLCKNKNITFNYELITKDAYIKIDPMAIDIIVNNVIDNAVRYTNQNGEVHVVINILKNNIEFIVKDTGIGISPDQLKHIFEKFYQISHEKRNIQGMGMGLFIVKKILSDIKAVIEIKSEIKKGSVFKITFNRHYIENNESIAADADYSNIIDNFEQIEISEPDYTKNKSNILIVEDNREMASYLVSNLSNDYNIFFTENGKSALSRLDKIPGIHLVISDIMMDQMDGYEFYERFYKNERFRGIPFIFITAKSGENEKIDAIKKGAIDFICKPFLIEELQVKINSIIKIQSELKQSNEKYIKKKMLNFIDTEIIYGLDNNDKENIETFETYTKFEKLCSQYKITEREKEVVMLLIKGNEYKIISDQLDISINTVRAYIKNIYSKCNVQNKVELINIFNPQISRFF